MLQRSTPLSIPVWVTTRIDDEAVEHYRSVGCFTPAEDRMPLTVEIVQRDDLSPDGNPVRVTHNPAQVRMAGIRLTPEEAGQLAGLLRSAAGVIQRAAHRDLPRRNWSGSFNGGYGLAPTRAEAPVEQRRSA